MAPMAGSGKYAGIVSLEDGWAFIEKGIGKLINILEGKPEPQFESKEFMLLYTAIFNLCTQQRPNNYSQQLYHKYRSTLEKYLIATVLPSIKEKCDEFMLRELVQRWSNHIVMVRYLSRMFGYLDRFFITQRSLRPLKDVGLICFGDLIIQAIKCNVKDAVITLIDQERAGYKIDKPLVKNVLDIFVEVGSTTMDYYEDFEDFMLQHIGEYYHVKAQSWIDEYSFPDYMIKVEECLKTEKERVGHYLQINSVPKLLEIVQNELLARFARPLLLKEHSGCAALLGDNKVEDLSRMYNLFSVITCGLEIVSNMFKTYVTNEGLALINQAEDAADNKAFVWKIIELLDKSTAHVIDCFQSHTLFFIALKEAFEVFCNKKVSGISSVELLATFCDNILKKGCSEKLSDEAIEDTLDKIVQLLQYVSDRDLFIEFYWRKLARKLLSGTSANIEHETCFVTKLKRYYGDELPYKMERIIRDVDVGRGHQTEFEEFVAVRQDLNPGVDLAVTVVAKGLWPTYITSGVNLPSEMVKCVDVFNEFYKTRTTHRQLTWISSLGTCNINAHFAAKDIELIVTTHQAALLLLFNEANELSYSEIITQLNLPDKDVKPLLYSLACAKYMILNKKPAGRTISPNDTFEFNSNFIDKKRRIKIPEIALDGGELVDPVVAEPVFDRRYSIDASIVRIMKSRKVMAHKDLVVQCVEQLRHRFEPHLKEIKNRIEDLISRDYLERDKDNDNMYLYVA